MIKYTEMRRLALDYCMGGGSIWFLKEYFYVLCFDVIFLTQEYILEVFYIDATVQFCRPFLGVRNAEIVQFGLELYGLFGSMPSNLN